MHTNGKQSKIDTERFQCVTPVKYDIIRQICNFWSAIYLHYDI